MFFSSISKTFVLTVCVCGFVNVCVCDTVHVCDTVCMCATLCVYSMCTCVTHTQCVRVCMYVCVSIRPVGNNFRLVRWAAGQGMIDVGVG